MIHLRQRDIRELLSMFPLLEEIGLPIHYLPFDGCTSFTSPALPRYLQANDRFYMPFLRSLAGVVPTPTSNIFTINIALNMQSRIMDTGTGRLHDTCRRIHCQVRVRRALIVDGGEIQTSIDINFGRITYDQKNAFIRTVFYCNSKESPSESFRLAKF